MLDKYYMKEKIEVVNRIILFIVLIMLCIIPIITHIHTSTQYSPIYTLTMYSTGRKVELFNFYKAMVLYIGTFIVFVLSMYKIIFLKEEFKRKKINIILFILAIGVILSPIFSKYKDIALFGNFDRYEGALSWFCYIVIFFTLYNIKIEEKYFKYFYFGLFPFLIINLFLVLANFYGFDVLKNSFVQFILGSRNGGTFTGTFWTTLYQFNFMSGISAVTYSMSFVYMLFEEEHIKKILALLGTIISFTIVVTSNSLGGFLTSLVLTPIIIVLAWRFIKKKELTIYTSIMLVLNGAVYLLLSMYKKSIYDETFAIFAKLNSISVIIIPMILVLFIGIIFVLKYVNNKKFFDYSTILFVAIVSISTIVFSYTLNKEKQILSENPSTNISSIKDSHIFNKLNELSTDRLNIWSRALQFINENPVIGNGFDTFPYRLINEDKSGAVSKYGEIIDKTHSWYVEVAYGSGLVGLIGLVGIIISLLRNTFYKYVDQVNDKFTYIFAAAVLAYALQGILNDSFVGTSLIFWVFAGLSANKIFFEKNENNTK
ncbi:O-antigen ligase family protein [Clostridioides sp. ES-S-0108-01]|uniref:O-antigen ligase family protein n=1 Tax=Clostridioides sp. ES-S-0108-01 TaxID=2770773 RepID=UPI001D0C43AD|nr:O-antigen ligase family protein [Clostridioides sp. ES-S-0108-01]UDN50440.1 O-antigen ligase family protein [Clostridioides sp. ES-S-0107-01]